MCWIKPIFVQLHLFFNRLGDSCGTEEASNSFKDNKRHRCGYPGILLSSLSFSPCLRTMDKFFLVLLSACCAMSFWSNWLSFQSEIFLLFGNPVQSAVPIWGSAHSVISPCSPVPSSNLQPRFLGSADLVLFPTFPVLSSIQSLFWGSASSHWELLVVHTGLSLG